MQNPTSHALPERVIERLFDRFTGMYGQGAMSRMWLDTPLDEVKAVWAQSLGRFSLDELRNGLRNLEASGKAFPPSLPEFVVACRQKPETVPEMHRPALPVPKRTPEQVAAGAQKLAAAKAAVVAATRRNGDRDWAVRVLERAAAGDRSLAPITIQFAREALGQA
jgi:hypothetical protein